MRKLNVLKGRARRAIHFREVRRQAALPTTHVEFKPWMANGHPYKCLSDKLKYGIAVGVVHFKVVVTATTDGTHTVGSWHYKCRAVDFGGPLSNLPAWERYLLNHHTKALEIFGPLLRWIKNGVEYKGPAPDNPNHVH